MGNNGKPDFLVVGAAKSGTTSLFHYLNKHPDIYIPYIKECRFFSQLPKNFNGLGAESFPNSGIRDKKEYFELFNGHDDQVCGDISNDYLYYYKESIKNIKQYLGRDVKIIIIIRNPVDRAYSNYMHAYRDGWENLTFEESIIEEMYRVKNNWAWSYHYVRGGFYYSQVKSYVENFSNVSVYLHDELNDINSLMANIYSFLAVEQITLNDNEHIYNASGYPKSQLIHNFVNNDSKIKQVLKPIAKLVLPNDFIANIKNLNLKRVPLSNKTRLYLEDIYSEDIKKLSILLNKDLGNWITNEM